MAADPTDLPWRKRHPVLSRLCLYLLGLGLVVLLLVLLSERKETDKQDQREALLQELDSLALVLSLDPSGDRVIELLDENFSDSNLPILIRGRALRWRAIAWRKKKAPARVETYLKEAEALDLDPQERAALQLEWAEARLEIWDAAGALERLPNVRAVAQFPPLAVLRALLFAQAQRQLKKPKPGLADLREILAALPPPLDADRRFYVGGRPWTAAQAATVATEFLVHEGDPAEAPAAWRRLQRLASRDFDAQVACARGLLKQDLTEEARVAWERARRLDPRMADVEARKDPALAALE